MRELDGKSVTATTAATGTIGFLVNLLRASAFGLAPFFVPLVAGVLTCLTRIGIPFGLQSFKLAGAGSRRNAPTSPAATPPPPGSPPVAPPRPERAGPGDLPVDRGHVLQAAHRPPAWPDGGRQRGRQRGRRPSRRRRRGRRTPGAALDRPAAPTTPAALQCAVRRSASPPPPLAPPRPERPLRNPRRDRSRSVHIPEGQVKAAEYIE